ncbi:hypothetical protein ALQ97_05492 [Pseudomonas savastanoi pv. glycinea]|nr:hypothetical protein ALQ97_05492 [Pseudomonas savastanoi pv. glycinea]
MQHRQRLRRALHLLLEQPMNGLFQRIPGVGSVERHQQLLTLRFRQNRQIGQRRLRRTLKRLGQTRQRSLHIGADPLRADPAHHLDGEAEIFTQIVHREHQRIVGPLFAAEHLNTAPGRRSLVRVGVAIVEQGAEQRQRRRHAAATLSQGQRRMFVAQQAGQAAVSHADRVTHTLPVHRHTHRQGIDEHAQRMIGALSALHPTQQHRAEHHFVASADTAQHLCPGQVHQARRADAQLTRLAAKTPAQPHLQRQPDLLHAVTVTLHIAQTERQRRFIDIAKHVAEERFVLFATHAQPGLGDMVAVRHSRCEQLRLVQQAGLHFMHHHLKGGVVQRHVMEQQHADPAIVRHVFGIADAHHRRLADVQVLPGVQLNSNVAVLIPQRHLFDAQRCLAPDHLHRLVQALPGHGRAQDVVAIDHALQGLGEIVQACAVVEGELRLQHVGVALFGGQMVIEDAFLQRRQGIDVLHVGNAEGHRCRDPVDGVLVQVGQGQHVRGDSRAASGNEVGRHHDFAHAAYGRRQCRQRRLHEQHAHIGAQVHLAHALDQLHRQ